jgi:hypothetical protein
MNRALPILFVIATAVLVAIATVHPNSHAPATSPENAVQKLYAQVKDRDYRSAYEFVADQNEIDEQTFENELAGTNSSLRTYSSLEKAETHTLHASDSEAVVRADVEWATAVGPYHTSRDLKVVRDANGKWRVVWPADKPQRVPPQVIPVNYLRWDVIQRGPHDDWGVQNVDSPKVNIVSMNAIQNGDSVIVMGEIVNQDTVPGFVSVGASLIGQDGSTLGEESAFDHISHTLLPKEVSPFRIDFPGLKLDKVKSVRMRTNSLLVPASADPVISVEHQHIDSDSRGRKVLRGELVNQSGQTVNIPHVLATFYNKNAKVIWVSDSYVDKALLPQTPEPFAVDIRDDLAPNVGSYRVTVNHYDAEKPQ